MIVVDGEVVNLVVREEVGELEKRGKKLKRQLNKHFLYSQVGSVMRERERERERKRERGCVRVCM